MLVAAVFWAHVFVILALLRRTVGAIEAMDEYSQKYIAADENHLHGRSGDMLGPLSMKVVDLVCQTDRPSKTISLGYWAAHSSSLSCLK